MNDWIGLGVIVAIVIGALWFFSAQGKPYEVTPEEFERRARENRHMRAGLFGLMKLLDPKAAKAIEIQRDLQSGYYNKKQKQGDDDDDDSPKSNVQSPMSKT